jgi:hypothetical protein
MLDTRADDSKVTSKSVTIQGWNTYTLASNLHMQDSRARTHQLVVQCKRDVLRTYATWCSWRLHTGSGTSYVSSQPNVFVQA